MSGEAPLPTLLSQAFVAFTIEFDNEFEHRMPHRTTNHGSTPGAGTAPWLVSMAMWTGCMRLVPESGIRAADLRPPTRLTAKGLTTLLTRMSRWWGYLEVEPAGRSRADWRVRPSAGGRQARTVWGPLGEEVEERWRGRLGAVPVDHLREALWAVARRLHGDLPDGFPVFDSDPPPHPLAENAPAAGGEHSDLPLSTLLARPLLAFAIEFDAASPVPLAVCANVLRVLEPAGVPVTELPARSGIAREAIDVALGRLERRRLVEVGSPAGGRRLRAARLTAGGESARDTYLGRLAAIESRWRDLLGGETVATLRGALEPMAAGEGPDGPPLLAGTEPYPDGWRAAAPRPPVLPHFPMVSHRGGFPDGS
ncbi:MAG TPA: hypothetical protein VIA06_03290 [Candidatus Dormibacteraeota bacterium]|jgi:hypothetical protein|nr:hypothetical protein [Candidatus Dormibacteraeota bacterium]